MDLAQMIGMLAFFAGLTVFFLLYAIYAPIVDREEENQKIKNVFDEEEDQEYYQTETSSDSLGKYVRPILNNFLPQLPKLPLSSDRKKSLDNLIIKSGNPWKLNAEELIATMIAFGIIGFVVAIIFVATGQLPEQLPPIALILAIPLMGAAIPYSKYNSAKEARTKAIEKELPEALDLLTITISSGQAFEFALESVTKQLPEGTLKTELSQVVVELQAGSTLERSFKALSSRFQSDDLESFTKAVVQATKLGSDVSETLKQQADYVRSNYEARLQRMIARLETTMFIPLIATMLPAFMLILIAPTMVQLGQYL